MTHTLETLLPLLNSPEGLEQLRILTAEADGWTDIAFRKHPDSNKISSDEPNELWFGINPEKTGVRKLAEYTTSLDAIFAAEERLGLHGKDAPNHWVTWIGFFSETSRKINNDPYFLVKFTAAQRTIPFILTAQSIKK